jgi:hypothetical protein
MATGAESQEGTQPGAETPNADGTQPAAPAANAAERTFTQEQVNQMVAAKAKREAKRLVDEQLNSLFGELDVDDADHLREKLSKLPPPGEEGKLTRLERKLKRTEEALAAEKDGRKQDKAQHLRTMDDALVSRLAGEMSSNPSIFADVMQARLTDDHRGENGALDHDKAKAFMIDTLAKNPELAKPTGTPGAGSRPGTSGNNAPPKHDLETDEGAKAALVAALRAEGG